MNLALLMLLALLWAVVLLPSAVRSRRRSLHHSMGGFARTMAVLSGSAPARTDSRRVLVPADPARIVVPPTRAQLVRERRRRALGLLASASFVSLTGAVVMGGLAWLLAMVAVGAFGAYVTALRSIAVREQARRELVRLDRHRTRGSGQVVGSHRAVVGG